MPDNLPMHTWTVRLQGPPPTDNTVEAAYYRPGDLGLIEFKDCDGKIVYAVNAGAVLDIKRAGADAPREVTR